MSHTHAHIHKHQTMPPPSNPFHPALLLVDLQEDFVPPGSLSVSSGRSTIPPILHLLSLPFPLKVFTKDSHPPDHISFASNHPTPDNIPFESFVTISNPKNPAEKIKTRLWPVHCVRGTPGWEFIAEIKSWLEQWEEKEEDESAAAAVVVVVEKGQDPRIEMYSAFQDPFDGTIATGTPSIEAVFREKGVTDVFVVGLAGDYCVKESVIHSGLKGFRTWVVREGVASVDESDDGWGQAKKAMEAVGNGIVKLVGIDGPEVGWVKDITR